MAIKKKKNKFTVPKMYDTSVFAAGGELFNKDRNLFLNGGLSTPITGLAVAGGPDMNKILAGAPAKLASAPSGIPASSGLSAANISGAMGVAQGAMQLGSQMAGNLSTAGIGDEVQDTDTINRNDILSSNTSVDSKQTNAGGQALSGAMTGVQAGLAFGPWGAAIGGGVGALAGGLSSVFGNKAKENKAEAAETQWANNLQAKDRQFNQQDIREGMANFSALGGDLEYADGGQMEQSNNQLTEFTSGGSHQENINGGIQQGTGANGKPNLVEEGETKHEDYIFSDRLKLTPKLIKDFKITCNVAGKTFAEASKIMAKEGKERPNDPISNRGIEAKLAKLTAAQEGLKAKMEASKKQPIKQGIPSQEQQGIPMEQQQPMQENPQANIMEEGSEFKKGGWIQKAVNPKHIGFCTPMTKSTCTPRRKAFAMTMKKHHGFHALGGDLNFNDQANEYARGGRFDGVTEMQVPKVGIDQNLYARDASLNGDIFNVNPQIKNINTALKEDVAFRDRNNIDNQQQLTGIGDYTRYAPAITNAITGISDLMQKPEVVKYGRVSPERVTAHQDYTPVDTEWMNNKMNATYAGTRDQMINNAGGNRAAAMAGLAGINQQQQNAVGESYLKAQDINYQRRNEANRFNAGIEQQNVAASNAAQQTNLQLAMQEADMNARNRAAQRNAARNAVISGANTLGDIGRENFNANVVKSSTGYGTDSRGNMIYSPAEGTVSANGLVFRNGKWIKQ